MSCYVKHVLLCYITCVVKLCYITRHFMLYNMCHVMFYNICHVILYDMFKTEPNRTCYITCVMLCYIT